MTAPISIAEKPTLNTFTNEYKISSNNNQYLIKISYSDKITITINEIDSILSFYYIADLTLLSLIKLNKIFKMFDTLDEAYHFFKTIFDKNKINIYVSGVNMTCGIKIISLIGQEEEIIIPFVKKDMDKSLTNNILCNEVNTLKKKVQILENENVNLKNLVQNLDLRIKELEKIKIKEEEEKYKIDSKIFFGKDEIEFIKNRLNEIFFNKKISFNLLYRATRDGDKPSNFHSKCDNITQVLTLYKTTKGIKFGAYTDIGFDCSSQWKKDLKSFIFSLDKRKIYNAIGDHQVGCYEVIGPSFGLNDVAIYLFDNVPILSQKSYGHHTNKKISSFIGLNDYEINNGEEYFNLQEVEVFQVKGY